MGQSQSSSTGGFDADLVRGINGRLASKNLSMRRLTDSDRPALDTLCRDALVDLRDNSGQGLHNTLQRVKNSLLNPDDTKPAYAMVNTVDDDQLVGMLMLDLQSKYAEQYDAVEVTGMCAGGDATIQDELLDVVYDAARHMGKPHVVVGLDYNILSVDAMPDVTFWVRHGFKQSLDTAVLWNDKSRNSVGANTYDGIVDALIEDAQKREGQLVRQACYDANMTTECELLQLPKKFELNPKVIMVGDVPTLSSEEAEEDENVNGEEDENVDGEEDEDEAEIVIVDRPQPPTPSQPTASSSYPPPPSRAPAPASASGMNALTAVLRTRYGEERRMGDLIAARLNEHYGLGDGVPKMGSYNKDAALGVRTRGAACRSPRNLIDKISEQSRGDEAKARAFVAHSPRKGECPIRTGVGRFADAPSPEARQAMLEKESCIVRGQDGNLQMQEDNCQLRSLRVIRKRIRTAIERSVEANTLELQTGMRLTTILRRANTVEHMKAAIRQVLSEIQPASSGGDDDGLVTLAQRPQ